MSKLKILHVNTQAGGVAYYRHLLPARALRKLGHEVTYFGGEYGFFRDIGEIGCGVENWLTRYGSKHDIVHMGYSNIIPHTLEMITLRNYAQKAVGIDQRLITDIDDDLNNVPAYNIAYHAYGNDGEGKRIVKTQLKVSDGVSVTTPRLIHSLREYCREMTILPNYVDLEDWKDLPGKPKEDNDVRILFTGNLGRKGDIDQIRDVITKIVNKYDGKEGRKYVKLIFMGCTPDWAAEWLNNKRDPKANRAFYIQPCQASLYPAILSYISPDILISPLDPNEFNRSKSCIKAYDAGLVGATFICTDWDTYDDVPGDASLKCWSETQWEESLEAAINDPSLRSKLNGRLREWVESRDINSYIYKWEDFYASILAKPPITEEDLIGVR